MGRADFPPFFKFMEGHALGYYAELLYNNGYSLANLDRLGERDIKSLGITGTKEIKKLVDSVNFFRAHESRILSQFRSKAARSRRLPASRKAAADRSTQLDGTAGPSTAPEDASGVAGSSTATADESAAEAYPEYTATIPTANECARQATVYLAHQRVDRQWPHRSSELSRSLNLSTANPRVGVNRKYSISFGEGNRTDVVEPCRHEHGHAAKYCRVCADHVSDGIKGHWQYLTVEKVDLGGGVVTEVPVWKPFDAKDSIRIEFCFKKKDPSVKVRGAVADLVAMRWGERPMRRVDGVAVPFPTLNPRDIVTAPERRSLASDHCASEMARLNLELIEKTEHTDRIGIEQQQAREFADMAALSVALVMQMFDDERAGLEEEEDEARHKIEYEDLDAALDDMWQAFEDSMRDVAFQTARREGDVVAAQQRNVLENMEAIEREDIEGEEAAMRENLGRLAKLLHAQMNKLIDKAKKGEADASNAAKHSGIRCPVCRKKDCVFFQNKWHNHWKHHGGAMDLHPPEQSKETLSNLVGRSCEAEYREYSLNHKADRDRRRDAKRLADYSTRRSMLMLRSRSVDPSVNQSNRSMPSPIPADDDQQHLATRARPASAMGRTGAPSEGSVASRRPRSATPSRGNNALQNVAADATRCTKRMFR